MVMGRLPDDRKPRVESYGNDVVIWAEADGEPQGLVITGLAAIDTGLAMLRCAGEVLGEEAVGVSKTSFELHEAIEPSEEVAARVVVTLDGARFAVDLGAAEFVELAAAFAAIARDVG